MTDPATGRADTNWRDRAACRGVDPELFFPETTDGTLDQPLVREQVEAAKAVCRRCPVREQCLVEALERLPHGVAGGMTEHERRRARAQRDRLGERRGPRNPRWLALLESGSSQPEVAAEYGCECPHRRPLGGPPALRARRAVDRPDDNGSGRWLPVSALEVSRREQAAWSTREHVRRVAVTAFDTIEQQEPIEGFHGLSRPVLCDPLAGVRAGRLVADVAAGALRDWALRARGAGHTWDAVGRALDLAAQPNGITRAEEAWEWLIQHRPPPPTASTRPDAAVWTCTTCRARVRDSGPFDCHPDDRETGHLADCARRTAALEAWRIDEGRKDEEGEGDG
jgi:hypothetical protein